MARRQKRQSRNRPQGPAPQGGAGTGGGFFGSGLEPYFSERSVGRLVDHSMEAAGNYLAAQAGGQTFNPMMNLGSIGSAVGGALGIPFGAPGMMLGGMLGGGIGGMISAIFGQQINLQMSQGLASAQSGFASISGSGLLDTLGVMKMAAMGMPSLGFAAMGVAAMPDTFNQGRPIGYAQANYAIGALAQNNSGSPLSPLQNATELGTEASALIDRFKSPPMLNGKPNPAFEYEVAALAPAMNDPLLNAGYARALTSGGSLGMDDIQASILEIGGPATYRAVNVAGSQRDRSAFGRMNYDMSRRAIESSIQSVGTGSAATVLQEALMEGNRSDALTDFGKFYSAEDTNISALTNERSLYDPNSRNPIIRRQYTNLSNQIQQAQTAERAGRFQQGTLGADPSDIVSMGHLGTAIQMIESSPFGEAVPVGLRTNLIGQYGNQLQRIDAQIAGSPANQRNAVAANLEPQRDQYLLQMQQQRNALLFGDLGHLLDVSSGAPGGTGGFGMASRSLRGYQNAEPGGNRTLGGSGMDVHPTGFISAALGSMAGAMGAGSGSDGELKQAIRELTAAIKGSVHGSIPGGGGGVNSNTPTNQIRNRANGQGGIGTAR